MVQLRHKSLPRVRLLELACDLAAMVRAAGALFVVNDHLDIALLAGADGVHLGTDDLDPAAARRVAGPELLVGASASSPAAAIEAAREGADYLGSGPAFATPLKPEKDVIGPAGVAAIAAAVTIPVFAIGGIDAGNVGLLIDRGIRRVCLIRALADADDSETATRHLRDRLGL